MKRHFFFFLLVAAVAAAPAFYLAKGKDKKPSDGVARKYKSKPVKKPVAVKLSDGMEYTVTSKGNGPMGRSGDTMVVLYTGKFTNDTVFDASSRHGNVPLKFRLGRREVIAGWDSVMSKLRAGDKATMRIPPQYGYGKQQRGSIPPNSTLVFEVEVIDVISRPEPWSAKGKDTITTPSGLKVVMFESHPENPMPKKGQNVSVSYSGFLLDGSMFDSSTKRGPYTFPLGAGQVIKGWDEGIALLRKGEKAKLIIPYTLGYGEMGRPPLIPAKSTLVFDVELVDIK
jgi:peptidylprolyl isomerase